MIGSIMRLSVNTLAGCHLVPRVCCVCPYFCVRTNSDGLRRMSPQIASKTALQLLMLTPTPSAISVGKYKIDFHPARFPKSSRCPKTKNVLVEHVASTNNVALKNQRLYSEFRIGFG